MSGPTIRDVLTQQGIEGEQADALNTALLNREDALCDLIRLSAIQFGLFPEIVAEVLATIELGTPPPEEVRVMIHAQFVDLMQRLQAEGQ